MRASREFASSHRLTRSAGDEVFWKVEVDAVIEFWRDDDPTRITDAAFVRVLDQLGLFAEKSNDTEPDPTPAGASRQITARRTIRYTIFA